MELVSRPQCLSCCRKHLAKAQAKMAEVQWHAVHGWAAVGELAEAEEEIQERYPALAEEIRKHRMLYMDSLDAGVTLNEETGELRAEAWLLHEVPIYELLETATKLLLREKNNGP